LLLWVAARRLSSPALAAATVWVLALSPAVIKFYGGGASSQALIFFFFSAVFALMLGAERKTWQLALGGFLCGCMVITRENTLPVFPLLTLYALWQNGWKKALWFFLPGALALAAMHALYYPEILRLWYWLPLVKIPAEQRYAGGGYATSFSIPAASRWLSLFEAARLHWVALLGSAWALLLFPAPSRWKSKADWRVFAALLLLFWGLAYLHLQASVLRNYCVFCFSPYLAFFNSAGILLVAVSIRWWNLQSSRISSGLIFALLLIFFSGLGFSLFERIGAPLLNLPAPRISRAGFLPGFTNWDALLTGGLNLEKSAARQLISAVAGLLAGGLFLALSYSLWRIRSARVPMRFSAFAALAALLMGMLSSPWLHGNLIDCPDDIIAAHEQTGAYLASVIPPDKSVYWDGGLSAAPLLYLPGRQFFPAQINSNYTFLHTGETAQVQRFGYWNEALRDQWKASADFFLVSNERYAKSWVDFFTPDSFVELPRAPVSTACAPESRLRVFRRK